MLTPCLSASSRFAISANLGRMFFSPSPSIAQACLSMPQLDALDAKLSKARPKDWKARL